MMISKIMILIGIAGLASAGVLHSKGTAVSTQHVTRYKEFHHQGHHDLHSGFEHLTDQHGSHHSDPQYEFRYSVSDPHTKDEKGQQESRHGDVVQGEYSLLQPDGSYTKVEYTADDHNGFNAVVHNTATDHEEGTSIIHDHY